MESKNSPAQPKNSNGPIGIDREGLIKEGLNENQSQNPSNKTERPPQKKLNRKRNLDIVPAVATKLKKIRRAYEKELSKLNFDNKCAKTPKLKKIRRAFEKELSKSKFVKKCAKTPKLKKIRRAFEKELSKSKFVKKCAKTPKEPKIYLSFAKILKKLLEEIATKERKENRKIFLFTFNSYKSLEQEVGEWGQHTIGILDFIILLIGDENNPGDFYCELKDKYSEEAFKTLRINIKSLRFLCSPDEHYSEDFKKEISKIGRKNVQFSSRIHAKLPETEPEKNKEKKPKLPYNVYRPLLTAIKRILKKEGTLENLKKNNSSDLFIMSKGKEDLFNKFKKMSTEALEKVKDCLHKLWKKPAKNLIEYNDALPKAIEESIKCIEIELRRPKEVPNNDNEMLPEEVPINDNEMVPEEVPINDNEMVPEEVPINDNEMVLEEVPINDNEMRDLDNLIENLFAMEEEDIVEKYLSR